MSNFEQIQQRDKAVVMNTYSRFPVAMEKGSNATCWDFDGKSYIDFSSGIGVNSLGFCDPLWQKAISEQAGKLQHISNLFHTEPCIQVAERLTAATGMSKIFFCNSGAESNECAIKAARKYSFLKYGGERNRIICLNNSFHGRTLTTLSATGQPAFHNYFFPFTQGFSFAEANNFEDVLAQIDDNVCAIMFELIQGEGGVLPLEKDFVQKIAQLCQERDILLIVDEVQTGIGRTGTLYAYEQFGIQPDIITSAKGLGGGIPFGATIFNEKTSTALVPGDHGSTYGGNPIAAAASLVVLDRINQDFLNQVQEKGRWLRQELLTLPKVTGVDGMGLMLGIRLEEGVASRDVVAAGLKHGVVLLTAKQKLRILPPLTITQQELEQGVAALKKALEEF